MVKNIVFKQFLPHIFVAVFFILLSLIYFQPVLEGKVLQQSDISQWRGMAEESFEFHKTNPHEKSAWSGSMFSGMPSYHFGAVGYPSNYLGYFEQALSLNNPGCTGPVFAGLICAYILFFLLTGNIWLSLIGAIAFAFSSYNLIILQAGHVTKAWAIAFMPLVLSGLLLVFRKKQILGGGLFAFALGLELMAGHIQITYYLAIFCIILYIAYLINSLLKKEFKSLLKSSLILSAALILAVIPQIAGLYADLEMSKTSLRGPSELSVSGDSNAKPSTGLDIDYAFQWSYGKGETMSLMVPNIKGGASGGSLDKNSHLYKELKGQGQRLGKDVQSYTYWGEKPFTSGPVYFGATICFLFVLGMFVIKNQTKWWLLGLAVLFIFLSWGKNLAWFNNALFYYLPMYNKFRTPEMSLVIPGLIFPIIAAWGLKYFLKNETNPEKLKKQFIYSLGITGAICLLFWLLPGIFFNFQSSFDKSFISQVPDWYYDALIADRESLLKSDAFRSLIFILLSAAVLYPILTKNKKNANYSLMIIALLVLIDLWTIDKRYLNASHFEKKKSEKVFEPTQADQMIFKDKTPSYRVLNLSVSTFNETSTSYFHKSIGGYHAAKLRRYQELIDFRISKEMQLIIERLQTAKTYADLDFLFENTPTINMLNGKYIIINPNTAPLTNSEANGNAWFVEEIAWADNADRELEALNTIDPRKTAVIDKRFENLISKTALVPDSTAFIELTEYRPNYLKYQSGTASEQLAVFSEVYYETGWKAFIDGKPAEHFRVDWILRAMYVPAGEHTIEFRFAPDTYSTLANTGSIGSIVLILGFIFSVFYSVKKRKKISNTPTLG
jgi:hypothetical protein